MAGAPQRAANYLRAAFLNVYNAVSLAGVALAAGVTHEPWVLAAGAAAEAAWLVFAPTNRRFRRAVDARGAEEGRQEQLRLMQEQAALLPSEERQKVQQLGARVAEMKAECLRNPRLQGDFMQAQLNRLEGLVNEYIHLAVTASRCDTYLNRADTKHISRERDEWTRSAQAATDESGRALAQQNVAILEKRLALADEMGRFVTRARGQMALIQNTVALLRDQVMTMATPEALTVQLDELVVSIEAIRDVTHEIESAVGAAPLPEAVPPPSVASADPSPTRGGRLRT